MTSRHGAIRNHPGAASLEPMAYTLATAAAATGLSERSIADAIRRGDLIAYYPTKRPQILAEDLRAWIVTAQPAKSA